MFCIIVSCFLRGANVTLRVCMLGKAVLSVAKGSGILELFSVLSLII